jgi:DNA primase
MRLKEKILEYFCGDYSPFYKKYLQRVKKIGDNERQALCVFHNDTKPSFSFNSQTGQYYCHGCNKRGDIFHFYGKLNGLDT